MKAQGLDALIPIGGEDTLGVAGKLHEDGIHVVGVPKTIDNDLAATDFTFGFQTAVQIATDAIDRLHTTAESHNRVIIVEVMGRHAGWIALYSGIAGGADVVLIPEKPFDIDEVVRPHPPPPRVGRGRSRSSSSPRAPRRSDGDLITDAPDHGRVRPRAPGRHRHRCSRRRSRRAPGYESRMTILGHVQRGGTPLAFDRVLGTRFGVAASTRSARATSARWSRCAAPRSSACRSPRRSPSPSWWTLSSTRRPKSSSVEVLASRSS